MAKYTYALQCEFEGRWWPLGGCTDVPLSWARGFMAGRRELPGPTLAFRIVRSDGKIDELIEAQEDVGIGMVAGCPTAEQYERAAQRALDKAKRIREHQARKQAGS